MKDKYEGCYIDGYKDHYAVFADNGEKLAEYDTHKEAKEDIAEWEAEVKNESYIPADTLATGYRFTIHETELLENAIKKHVEQKVDQGVNAMFDTDSEEFKKVGNEPYDKSQWWDDMKLTMRIKKTPFPRKNGYTNGDFRPNQKWLMGAIECCKSARDCDYLLKDAYLSVAHDKKLIQNLKSVRDGNPNKYVNVKVVQKWLDNGVTPEKVEKHIEWFKANYIKGLQAKKKEFNKAQNETATEEPMNEILITLAIFGTIWGLSCLYERIVEAKNKAKLKKDIKNAKKNNPNISDRELDEIMGIIGITEKEINELARQSKALKTDITAKQKSSPLYKDLYQYMKEWNTDDYMDAVKAIKSGETVDLSLDFRTDVYYAFVEFFNQSNPNFRKQVKDLTDDEAEKLEIKYEKDSFDEMKKHLVSLGFDLNKPVTNNHRQYYSSKKYPDLIIRYADGDDGTGIIVEPKCTLGATKFKLISEEEGNKKLNGEPMDEVGVLTAINIGLLGFVGICCIVSGILDKKHGKEIKANLTDAEFKAIKNDTITVAKNLIAAQKSSPFYNSIYKHNWITQDTYKDMINAFNKGDLCSSTVRFFDAENFENYKSYYKEYGEWGDYNPNWEKLEKSVNADMVKIIESLGFDIKTGKSPKYPNCEVRVADGEVVYVYPKAPDDILERGKKSKKKLNEDHSEISNDPEMEELMALAGVTTADLDDLENDNDLDLDDDDPIDANTLREIDAAMDESVKSALEHIETADKAIDKNIEQIEKFIPCANKFLDVILRDTIIEVPDPELSKLTPKQRDLAIKLCKISERFKKDCHNFDYDRGSSEELSYWSKNWIGYRYSTILDKFSYSNKKVSPAQIAFFKKCAEGGEYDKRLKKCVDEFNKIAHRVKTYQAKAAKEEDKREDGASCYNLYLLDEYFIPEYRYFSGQIHYTSSDIQGGLKYSGRTRTSFFGKKVKDSINESVGGVIAISVAGLIGGAAIVNAITERKLKAEAKELTKAEFDKLINDMVSINEAVISKLKTSKWWKFIYEPCMNRKNSPDIHNQASKYKQEFMSGKCIGPSFHSSFVDIDDPDPKIYTKLDAEIGRSPDDEAWEKAFDSAYYESQKLIKEAVKKLGFNDEGKSTKYPDIKIDIGSGEYIGIWIEPIYNGYYKLKDSKKSQNESVETNLDILLTESAEFLFDE